MEEEEIEIGTNNNAGSRNQNDFMMKHKSSNFSNNKVGASSSSKRVFSD